MKLLYCTKCGDVVRLIHTKWRKCECGKSGGQYNVDLITATVAGECKIFGIPNPFFDEVVFHLRDDSRQWYRDKFGYGKEDIWYGEKPGDLQIFRIQNANGPRLKCTVKRIDKTHSKTIITDKRDYVIDGENNRPFVICENNFKPSFKKKK